MPRPGPRREASIDLRDRLPVALTPIAVALPIVVALAFAFGPGGVAAGDPGPPKARASLPVGCGVASVTAAYQGLLSAFNRGDRAAALARIAPQGELNDFGVGGPGPGQSWAARSPADVFAHFAARARGGERLRLLAASVEEVSPGALNNSGPWHHPSRDPANPEPVVGVGFVLRQAGGGGGVLQAVGKSGFNCASGRIYHWTMGFQREPRDTRLCGAKPPVNALRPPRHPVTCAR